MPKSSAGKVKKNQEKQVPPDEQLPKVDISTTDPRTIVLMLDSPEQNVISKACEALLKHIEGGEQGILEIVDLGGIPKMIKLISSTDKLSRCHAVLCLCAMGSNTSVRQLLYKSDFLPSLLKLLQPDEEVLTQERATFILSLLAADYSFKVRLGEQSAHKPLLLLSQSSDPDIQRNSIKILCEMMENFELRPAFLDEDGLPTILKLLDSEYAIIQELSLQTLRSCVHHAPSRQVIAGGEGISRLVGLLGDKECVDLHVLTMEVLGLCLADTDSMSILQGSGCLGQFLTHVSDSSSQLMKTHATNTLAVAATNALNRKILHENEAEKVFIELLSKEDGVVAEAICAFLGNMAELNTSRQLIGRDGGVAELVKHIAKSSHLVRAAAVYALSHLLQESPANCKLFVENGGLEALVPLFSDSQAKCRQFAAECIVCVACDESVRKSLISGGAVTNLVGSLSFQDSSVRASTAKALGMLACDQAARQQVYNNGGLEPLLQLLHSANEDLMKNALWLLMVCAQSAQVAEEACRLGAIELVQQIAECGNNQSVSMAECALKRLFGANLPAKYWVNGCLALTDSTVNSEFYDAGPAMSSGPFTPLSELLKEPLKLNQPIITANLLAKPANYSGSSGMCVSGTSASEEPPSAATPGEEGQSSTSISSGGRRTGSRLHTSKSRRGKAEREVETKTSHDNDGTNGDEDKKLPGLLEIDTGLWEHIQNVWNTIKLLPSTTQQVQELARYVATQLGGKIERSGPLCFELPVSHTQTAKHSNVVPLGDIKQGSFQHRAMLFKVLCDTLGVPCSLVRGEYSRHWNEVSIIQNVLSASLQTLVTPNKSTSTGLHEDTDQEPSPSKCTNGSQHLLEREARDLSNREQSEKPNSNQIHQVFVVDLMFNPGELLPSNSPKALQYQHVV